MNNYKIDTSFTDFLNQAQDLVYSFGAVTLQQFSSLFPKIHISDMERILSSRLISKKQCQQFGRYFCPEHDTSMANPVNEISLWVALDILNYQPELIGLATKTISNDYLVIKGDTLYEIDYLHSNNVSSKIAMINEKYNTIHKNNGSNVVYVLVLDSEALLDKLEDYNLLFPHIFAVVNMDNLGNKPEILTTELVK